MFSRILGLLSVLCLGAVVLFVFFVALGAISPGEAIVPAVVVGVLALLLLARSLYVRHELGEHGNKAILRSINSLRERRGF
jgi:hypothetical protein